MSRLKVKGSSTTTATELGLFGMEWMRRQYYQGSHLTAVYGVLPDSCHKRRILGEIIVFDRDGTEMFRRQVEVSGPPASKTDQDICKEVASNIAIHFKRGRTAPKPRKRRTEGSGSGSGMRKRSRGDNDGDDGNKKPAARNTHASAVMPDLVGSNAAADNNEDNDEAKKPPAASNPASEAMPDQVGSAAVAETSNSAFEAVPDLVASAGAVPAAAVPVPQLPPAPVPVPVGPIPAAAAMPQQHEPDHYETLNLTDEEIDSTDMSARDLMRHLGVMQDLGIDTTVYGLKKERARKLKAALKLYRSLQQNP